MKIAIGCDHGGYDLKQTILQHLHERGDEVLDVGCFSTDSCDYPDYARPAAQAVAAGECEKGIVICTTGIGVSVTANKVRGIRCAHCTDVFTAEMTRLHNDANVLALGAKLQSEETALAIVDRFLDTAFSGEERHLRRIRKIHETEE